MLLVNMIVICSAVFVLYSTIINYLLLVLIYLSNDFGLSGLQFFVFFFLNIVHLCYSHRVKKTISLKFDFFVLCCVIEHYFVYCFILGGQRFGNRGK